MVTFLFFIIHAILMGMLAQMNYRKTGAIWGLITFVLDLVFGFFVDSVMTSPEFLNRPNHYDPGLVHDATVLTFWLLTFVPSTLIVWGVLATLPKRPTA